MRIIVNAALRFGPRVNRISVVALAALVLSLALSAPVGLYASLAQGRADRAFAASQVKCEQQDGQLTASRAAPLHQTAHQHLCAACFPGFFSIAAALPLPLSPAFADIQKTGHALVDDTLAPAARACRAFLARGPPSRA